MKIRFTRITDSLWDEFVIWEELYNMGFSYFALDKFGLYLEVGYYSVRNIDKFLIFQLTYPDSVCIENE